MGVRDCLSLEQIQLQGNKLTGRIPLEFTNLRNLTNLDLSQNQFTGSIPPQLGNCTNLQKLCLSSNLLTGELPKELGKLSQLRILNVSSNSLKGSIHSDLANCSELLEMDVSSNSLTGTIPPAFGMLIKLEKLVLSENQLTGLIPSTLGNLTHLIELQMGGNNLSGRIPWEIGKVLSLQIALNLSYNKLSGDIPTELGSLTMLEYFCLESNELYGQIPPSFANLTSLIVLNISFNHLTGPIPSSVVFQKMSVFDFLGNDALCGAPLPEACEPTYFLPPHVDNIVLQGMSMQEVVGIGASVVVTAILVIMVGACWFCRRSSRVFIPLEEDRSFASDSYFSPKADFKFQDILEATNNFSKSFVIGSGACGTVYKVVIPSQDVIAVKRLARDTNGSKLEDSFHAEIATLGKIRHRNIVKLYGFCFHPEANLLLYEYMARGSLGELLHSDSCDMEWEIRYQIAVGAAEGLCYLHHDCKPGIVHRDIKSSNILLDENFEAHVGDFGLAKMIDVSHSKSMSAVAGSYGYIAPEYAYTMRITEKCDIYSFGVVLLELLTGQQPVQPLDQGGDLVNWVKQALVGKEAGRILDSRLNLSKQSEVEEMLLVLKVALFCTKSSPLERPTMREVVRMLVGAREKTNDKNTASCSSFPVAVENQIAEALSNPAQRQPLQYSEISHMESKSTVESCTQPSILEPL